MESIGFQVCELDPPVFWQAARCAKGEDKELDRVYAKVGLESHDMVGEKGHRKLRTLKESLSQQIGRAAPACM